jgi:hypothetical protein
MIDGIIADLESRIGEATTTAAEEKLNEEQMRIKELLNTRNIRYLIHFTDAKNIPSIKKKGLLSVSRLCKEGTEHTINDTERHDHAPDFISLSVSGINTSVYNSFLYIKRSIEHGVAVIIDASMLYREINNKRIYCVTNAATANAEKGSNFTDLDKMFAEIVAYTTQNSGTKIQRRNEQKRLPNEPTDAQAEILWHDHVSSEYILCYWDIQEDFFYGD